MAPSMWVQERLRPLPFSCCMHMPVPDPLIAPLSPPLSPARLDVVNEFDIPATDEAV